MSRIYYYASVWRRYTSECYNKEVKVSPFIEMIKQGKRVKAGTHWLSTHKSLPLCRETVPSAYLPRIAEVLHRLAEAEKAKPSPPGQSALIKIKGKAGAGFSYKWLGKDEMGKRVAIVALRWPARGSRADEHAPARDYAATGVQSRARQLACHNGCRIPVPVARQRRIHRKT
jgi:hypothetical protein